ncbi:hypothetical protein OROGR_009317 [Orobanche gracilis]
MANVPPVVFPSGGSAAAPSPGGGQQRRFPTPPFQPPRSSNPGLPFLTFDINSAAASTSFSAAPKFPSIIGGGGYTSFEDEPPLLEELGINTNKFTKKPSRSLTLSESIITSTRTPISPALFCSSWLSDYFSFSLGNYILELYSDG